MVKHGGVIMEIYVDTAELGQIKEAFSWGFVDGVTTNPSLIKKAVDKLKNEGKNVDMQSYITELINVVASNNGKHVSLEVIGVNEESMINEAEKLVTLFNSPLVVVKVPVNPGLRPGEADFDGLKVIRKLSSKGIKTNATLIMSPEQAFLCAKAGATYVSPFMGRIDDLLSGNAAKCCGCKHKEKDKGVVSGNDLVEQIVKIFKVQGLNCKVLAASIRDMSHVRCALISGAHVSTIPFNILTEMVSHVKTFEGMGKFVADVVPEYSGLFEQKSVNEFNQPKPF